MKNNANGQISWTAVIIAGVVVVAVLAGIFAFNGKGPASPASNQGENNTSTTDSEWALYKDDASGFMFRYPREVFSMTASSTLTIPGHTGPVAGTLISHTIPVQHCGLSGLPEHCTPTTQDIGIGVYTLNSKSGTILSALKNTFGDEVKTFLDGGRQGFSVETGVEGEGIVYYFVPLDSGTLVLTRSYLNEQILGGYKDKEGFINFENQKKLFDQVVSTLTFFEPEKSQESVSVSLFFYNPRLNPSDSSCTNTVSVARIIPKTQAVATAAIRELLKGPDEQEKSAGYTSALPEGSTLNSLSIKDQVATADFSAKTESGGGSCSMAARVAQIRQTLLQFPTVKDVKLSIDGRTGDIFQP